MLQCQFFSDRCVPEQSPWMMCSMDGASLERCVPWTMPYKFSRLCTFKSATINKVKIVVFNKRYATNQQLTAFSHLI
jgi:hypothetical protein